MRYLICFLLLASCSHSHQTRKVRVTVEDSTQKIQIEISDSTDSKAVIEPILP